MHERAIYTVNSFQFTRSARLSLVYQMNADKTKTTSLVFICVHLRSSAAIIPLHSHGLPPEEARTNLIEALTLFFETAAPSEVARRFRSEVFVTQVEVPIG
jgi:hypothetical protein